MTTMAKERNKREKGKKLSSFFTFLLLSKSRFMLKTLVEKGKESKCQKSEMRFHEGALGKMRASEQKMGIRRKLN